MSKLWLICPICLFARRPESVLISGRGASATNKGNMSRVLLRICASASFRFSSSRFSSTLHQPRGRSPEAVASDYALQHGYDPNSFWTQPVGWGDLDSFRLA